MSDETDREAAFDELVRRVPHDSEPSLSREDLEGVINNNQKAQRWAATAGLPLGVVVMPTTRNGHVYRVIEGGTSAGTEPTWPTGSEDTVVDGTVTLIEAGTDFANVFDIRGAIQEALELKALRSAELHEGGESKLHEHLREMAREWATPLIG